MRARCWKGFFPGIEVAIWEIGATVKNATFSRFAFNDIAAILGTFDVDLNQPGFCVAAFGEITAANELAKTSPARD